MKDVHEGSSRRGGSPHSWDAHIIDQNTADWLSEHGKFCDLIHPIRTQHSTREENGVPAFCLSDEENNRLKEIIARNEIRTGHTTICVIPGQHTVFAVAVAKSFTPYETDEDHAK